MMSDRSHAGEEELERLIGADDGSRRALKQPSRQCAVTRDVLPRHKLIRFVADPSGQIVPDLKAVLPGRGVWITAERALVEQAEKRKVFRRALGKGDGASVDVAPGLADRVETLLRERALGALALAQKSGRIITGFAKVEAAIGEDKVLVLVVASDGAQDSLRKLKQAVTRRWGSADALPLHREFGGVDLDLAFGRTNVIHAALMKAENASKQGDGGFLEAVGRLHRFLERGQDETGKGA